MSTKAFGSASSATQPSALKRGPAVYVIAALFCFMAYVYADFFLIFKKSWDQNVDSTLGPYLVAYMMKVALCLAAALTTLLLRRETLLFHGCILALQFHQVALTEPGSYASPVVMTVAVCWSLRLAQQGRLR